MIGLNREYQKALDARRRFPRIFLMGIEEKTSLSGLLLMMPDRTHLPVLSISLSGLIISPVGYVSSLRLGQIFDCKLKIQGMAEPLDIKLKVVRLFSKEAYLMIESISAENRIALDQTTKDQLIFSSLRRQDSQILHPQFHDGVWLHSLFDTNFIFWKSADSQMVERAIIEYDGVCLFMNKNDWWLQKSVPSVEEAKGYAAPWMPSNSQKISLGASWKERLLRLMSQNVHSSPELAILMEILRKI